MFVQLSLLTFEQIVVGIIHDQWFFDFVVACSCVQERASSDSKGFKFNATSTNRYNIKGTILFKSKTTLQPCRSAIVAIFKINCLLFHIAHKRTRNEIFNRETKINNTFPCTRLHDSYQ